MGNLCNDVPGGDLSLPDRSTQPQPRAKVLHHGESALPLQDSSNMPKGLQNLTNTCYMSSILQVLFVILPESLVQCKGEITQLFFDLRQSKSKADYRRLKRELEKKIPMIEGNYQQDAQQFLLLFLEVLSQQSSPFSIKPKCAFTYNQNKPIEQNYNLYVQEIKSNNNSLIDGLFCAQLLQKLVCFSGHKKHIIERYQGVSLAFPPAESYKSIHNAQQPDTIHIVDLFKKQFGENKIDLVCQTCRSPEFTKVINIFSVPSYLLVHISRFGKTQGNNQKINTIVQFDEMLQIECLNNRRLKYQLMAVVNHVGTMYRGHYYAQVKYGSLWYEINDEEVRPCVMARTRNLSSFAYILVYEKKE